MVPTKHNTNLVLVQRKSTTAGQWGDVASWVEDRQVWVSIAPNRGREVFKGAELEAQVTHTIRGDFLELEGITESMRIIHHDTHVYDPIPDTALVFDILAVMPDHDHHADIMIQANLKPLRYGQLPADIPQ